MANNKYGWRPDLPDHRDYKFSSTLTTINLPDKIDLRTNFNIEVYDQGNLGSCTANAIASLYRYTLIANKKKDLDPSRLFIYYNERLMEGTVKEDSGAYIRDGIKSVNKQGVCSEKKWPYIVSKFKNKPTQASYTEAIKHTAINYARVTQTLNELKLALYNNHPVVFGFSVYESFESDIVARTGIVPMPSKNDSLLGGHAVLLMGYDNLHNGFIVRNSWGSSWGQNGYFILPYEYVTSNNLADDFWTITLAN